MKRSVLSAIISGLVILSYIALGVLVIVVGLATNEYEGLILGLILIISSAFRLGKFFYSRTAFDVHIIDLTMGLICTALGFIFIFGELSLEVMCIIWGASEIINGAIEISFDVKEAHKSVLMLISVLISIGEIVFGTLLCIHLGHGILAHLIFMSVTSFLTAALLLVQTISFFKKKEPVEHE